MIPYARQSISDEDIQSVVNVLRSDYLTQGSVVPEFEQAVASYVTANYAVAVNSGTSALHLACLALGLGGGDYLWTTPISFVASANCGLYCGAQVDFVDIDPATFNMSVSALAEKLQFAEQQGTLPKILVVVHFAGQPCDMQAIAALAKQYGFYIIEDAAHAIGAQYQDKPVGCCQYSDITTFSFHPVKIITTAEGGMAVTQQAELADKMRLLASHGITRDTAKMTKVAEGAWYYQQLALGFNYRMTELQAALGLSQLQRIDGFIQKRQVLKQRYDVLLCDLPVRTQKTLPETRSALHLYPLQFDLEQLNASFISLFNALRAQDIGINVHYIPIHTQPYYAELGFKLGDFPVAEAYYAKTLSLPLYADLSFIQQDQVVAALHDVL